jgi:hypothetical protein
MMKTSRLPRRPQSGCRVGSGLVLALAMVAAGTSGPRSGDSIVAAQGSGPCALLTTDDIQPLAPNTSIGTGVPMSLESIGYSRCQYTWGEGTGRVKVDVTTSEPSRMFAGAAADQVKQRLQASVTSGTADAVIPDVGEAAAFKADSALYVYATAYAKGRIVQVHLDGFDARDQKGHVISLLKSAVSRL